jgi:predicted TIM-barrel fold metal-dependent hydrolase
MIIDIFSHHLSEGIGKIVAKADHYGEGKEFPYPLQNADPEVRLALMKKYGVDIQAISQTTPVLLGLSVDDAVELCRVSNQDNYDLCKAYPDKFINICIFHLLDMKATMEELDRCVNELDCRGVTISTSQEGKGLDSPEFFPFYEKVVELDLPILLHGTHWESNNLMDMKNSGGLCMSSGGTMTVPRPSGGSYSAGSSTGSPQ